MSKTLYIIDGHAHIYAAYFAPMAQQLTSPSGEPTKATYIFTMALLGLIKGRKPDMLVVAMDSKALTFRSDLYKPYKAHRPPMPDDMPAQIERIEQILAAMRVPVLRVDGFEADDIIGTIAKKASAQAIDVFICTKDKDVLQLLDKHVRAFDIKSGTEFDAARMKDEMQVTPDQFVDVLALQGDASDNVPGVPDVGPKTAIEWIQKYGSLDNLYAHADEIKGKRGDNLRGSKDLAYLSQRLVTIRSDVPVGLDEKTFALKDFDKPALASVFTELGFTRLLSQLDLLAEQGGAPAQEKRRSGMLFAEADAAGPSDADYRLIDTPDKFETFLTELSRQKLFAVDTESTSVYPMAAELVGISFSWKPATGFYLPVKGPLGAKHLDLAQIRAKLAPVFENEKIKKVGQNIKYDILVLKNAGLELKGVCFDTMVASYCLDPLRTSHSLDKMALDFLDYECVPIHSLIGKGKKQITFDMVDTEQACRYSAEDADITLRLYENFSRRLENDPVIGKLFEDVEMPLVEVLAALEYNGVSIDAGLLKKISVEIDGTLKSVTDRIYEGAGYSFNIDSPKQLAEVLFDKLRLEPVRLGKTGRSTDADVLDQLASAHPVVPLILEYRSLSKLKNTYVDKLPLLVNPRTGRLHASFNQTITATGRLSSSDPNLQNIPIRTELGSKIRAAFVPKDKTDCILSADYSQIELRLLAHFSRDRELLKAFAEDQDIHRYVASQIFNVPIADVTGEMRSRCKAVNFGIIYGQGAFGLSRSAGISQQEAKQFIDDYFKRYSAIRDFMESAVESAKRTGYAETILHRRRRIIDLDSRNGAKCSQARRLAINTVIQGSAADLIKVAMINIHRRIEREQLPVKMILQVHDELVFELPVSQADRHGKWIADEMTSAIKVDVPLKVDVSHGPSWLANK